MDLNGKAVLVTGTKLIGACVAVDLAQRGMRVALAYNRSADEADAAARTIRSAGGTAEVLQADLADPDECASLVDRAAAALGRLDALINMASLYVRKSFAEADAAVWDAALAIDLRAAYLCARAAVPHLRAAGGGRIVNFSDWVAASGRPRYPGYVHYYVAKRAVIGLTEALALELAPDGILVNAVAPGPILPPPGTSDEEIAKVVAATPLGRWGGEAAIVEAVAFLMTTGFTTGETIRVDGGRHVR
jgi:NAD(P)-dependent dehydrogenase (short-subunit alcohol dehydrogenase family)